MPKNPHADFSPVLDGYSGIGAFRFWCQTALPLTYDDSLSYYELLCKVVNYLNHTIEDLGTVEENTSKLAEAYTKLQEYVNEYFDELDIEAELRNVLDAMAEDGTLDEILDPLVENQLPGAVDEKIDDVVASQIDEAVADQIDDSVADQLPAIVEDSIPGEVSDWLTENVDPVGSAVVVDSSLTISGAAADAKITGDEISGLKESIKTKAEESLVNYANNKLFDKEILTLPYTSDFIGQAIANPNDGIVISGTHNKGAMYPLQDGTYLVNGLTIVIDKNKITVDGTATAQTYISLRKPDRASSLSDIASENYDFLIGDSWYFTNGLAEGYTNQPNFIVRNKDNSGNAANIQANVVPFNRETFGGIYLYVAAGAETHRGGILGIINQNTRAYETEISERVKILNNESAFEIANNDVIIGTENAYISIYHNKKPKKLCLMYSNREIAYTGATEVIDIYVPMKTGYVDYIFGHTITQTPQSEGGGNVWRLIQIVKVNDDLEREYYITTFGETEMALKINGRDDFIGGFTHGDEWLNNAEFYIDGKKIGITNYTSITEFNELTIYANNTMYDPNDHNSIVGVHNLQWIFDNKGLTLSQIVIFDNNYELVGSYLTMICAIRNHFSSQTIQITDSYVDNGNYITYDVSEPGFTSYPKTLKNDVTEINLYGELKGVNINVQFIEQPKGLNAEGNYLFNGEAYNKIYNAICGYNNVIQEVTAGEKWYTKSKIIVTAD